MITSAILILLAVTPVCAVFGLTTWLNYKQIHTLTHALIAKNNGEYSYLEGLKNQPEQPSKGPTIPDDEPVLEADQLSEDQWEELINKHG